MDKLVEAKVLEIVENGRYALAGNSAIAADGTRRELVGKVDMTQTGAAYIVIEGRANDIFVSEKNLGNALNGDTVSVAIIPRKNNGGSARQEGEIIEVIKRATDTFICTLQIFGKYAFAIPDNDRMLLDIFVPLEQVNGAKTGEKAVVKVVQWHSRKEKNPVGKVTEVLGKAGSSDIEMKSLLVDAGFPLSFSETAIQQANALEEKILPEELAARRDFRGITTFTIDPEDAKDFDDAISYQVLENGNIEVGVHIADVTHYVRPGTTLDEEAFQRSTSVYLVDRCLPMLPERISNELCSLRPHEDKRTFSAVFEFDKDDKLVSSWLGKTYIHSNHRFSYEAAQEVLETKEGMYAEELAVLNRIAHRLRKAKYKNGAINFDAPEVRFKLAPDGTPIELYVKERKDAHLLIEDFMLLANRTVAEYIEKLQKGDQIIPFVYRIHDTPDMEKLEEFALFAKEIGFNLKFDTPKQIADSFNLLVKEAEEKEELKVLLPLAIRTMSKAAYSTDNIGHYGLAFADYSHFTSPIRRYSDVLSHRILYKNLVKPPHRTERDKLELKCKHISAMERKAMDAERKSIKYKQAEFIKNHIGETFEAIITGITERGMFVELKDNRCEARIDLQHTWEKMIMEGSYRLRGSVSNHIYKMGDTVTVRIVDVIMEKRAIDAELIVDKKTTQK